MTLKELKDSFDEALSEESAAERRAIYQHWCKARLQLEASTLLLHPEYQLSADQRAKACDDLSALGKGKPLQYVLGETEWFGMHLWVTEATLIPRPETEELMDQLARRIKKAPRKILDVGTGSGCIALALKGIFPDAQVCGVDISEDALSVARENARRSGLELDWRCLDFRSPEHQPHQSWDLIVSNPPYIAEAEREGLARQVREREPEQALFVPDEDPLYFYRLLAVYARQYLRKNALLVVEINQAYAQETAALFRQFSFQTDIERDQFQNDRFIWVRPK